MAADPYALCPCGSGKKFKWCCQPFYQEIEKAFAHHANGQHETALKIMDQLTQAHAGNPEVWGKRAELLLDLDQPKEAEESLDKALEVNPNYAFAYLLRGMMRHEEGEATGALILYRKAADLCDPSARDLFGEAHFCIGQCEVLLNRPLAARAAWEIARHCQPQNQVVQERMQHYFGEKSPYPPLARKAYSFKAPADKSPAWKLALAAHESGKLGDAVKAFEQLTTENPSDTPAWYNLGLARAWLGKNDEALEAFDTYVSQENDADQAAAAWALTEVLRFGDGMEDKSDWIDQVALYLIRDPRPVGEALNKDRRFSDLQQNEGMIGGLLLERELPPVHENLALYELPRVACFLVIVRDRLMLRNRDGELLDRGRQIMQTLCGSALSEPEFTQRMVSFTASVQSFLAVRLPSGIGDEQGVRLINEAFQQTFEEKWLNQPLKSLGMIKPIDAIGHTVLGRKVQGLIAFLDDLLHAFVPFPYDFDRLRHKLGLPTAKPQAAEETGKKDISALSAAELSKLEPEQLTDAELDLAFQTSKRLDARDVAGMFARAMTSRGPSAERRDRFAHFNHLIQLALDDGQAMDALGLVDAGEKHDCEHNEGRRRGDYEMRRAQVHLKAGEPDQAHDVFNRMLQRTPSDLELLGKATEAMLSAKRPQQAAEFAEKGLTQAKTKGDRDRAGYFQELLAAAKR